MKKLVKIVSVILVTVLALAVLASCGDKAPADTEDVAGTEADTEAETEAENVTGEVVEFGNYKVLVPAEFELKEPGEFSSYDFSVRKSDFVCFDFNTESDDELMMQHYNYNKNTYTNEQTDFEKAYGDNTWTGFQYSDGWGGYGFEAYTTLGEKIVRVSAIGFKYDSATSEAVLSSFSAK